MRLDVSGVDHLRVAGSAVCRKFAEQPLPYTALGPAHKAVVDRGRRAVFRRAVAPAAAALDHMQDAADHSPVVDPFLATHICRQIRLNPRPLFVVQPKQIAPYPPLRSESSRAENQQPIYAATLLLGFRPNDVGRRDGRSALSLDQFESGLGQFLARAQIEEGLHLIAQRLKNPRPNGEPAWRSFVGVWGLRSLPIAFETGSAA